MIVWPAKEPAETLDYAFDLAGTLQDGEAIAAAEVIPEGVVSDGGTIEDTLVRVELSGGTRGTVGRVTLNATTSAGRVYSETAVLEIGGGPISLSDAKKHLEIQHDDDDAAIASALADAIDYVEALTGKSLSEKVIAHESDGNWGRLRLLRRPLQQIVSVEYDPIDGGLPIVFTGYRSLNNRFYAAVGQPFPSATAIRVTYIAGYKPGEMPGRAGRAVKLLLGHFYANREAVADRQMAEIPLGVASLLRSLRTRAL